MDELEQARAERDRALQQLAEVRAELDAVKQAQRNRGEPEVPLYPTGTAPDLTPPLRYRVVDQVFGAVKRVLRRR